MAPGILTARENLPPAASNPVKKDSNNDYGPNYPKGKITHKVFGSRYKFNFQADLVTTGL